MQGYNFHSTYDLIVTLFNLWFIINYRYSMRDIMIYPSKEFSSEIKFVRHFSIFNHMHLWNTKEAIFWGVILYLHFEQKTTSNFHVLTWSTVLICQYSRAFVQVLHLIFVWSLLQLKSLLLINKERCSLQSLCFLKPCHKLLFLNTGKSWREKSLF